MKNQDRVVVMMSTYNGEKYLERQLQSIYAQSYSNITLLVRDDGSLDSTINMLKKEESFGRILLLEAGVNIGPAQSFLKLLRAAESMDADYFAFCDQDDIWLSDKIARAVAMLSSVTDPAMYCCRLELVDENLNHIGLTPLPRKIGFGNALVENIAIGCTIVLNRESLRLICRVKPENIYLHDWWCYLVISCFGRIFYDDEPLIKYRQHAKNVLGAPVGFFNGLKRKFTRFLCGNLSITKQALVFMNVYNPDIPAQEKNVITELLNSKSSLIAGMQLAIAGKVWRQKRFDNFFIKILAVLRLI